jgi:hypothetical protein
MHGQVAEAADRDGSSTAAPRGNNGVEDAAAAYARCGGAAVLQIHRSENLAEQGYVTCIDLPLGSGIHNRWTPGRSLVVEVR